MEKVYVICDDAYLFQKIKLILRKVAECRWTKEYPRKDESAVYLVDIDSTDKYDKSCILMSRGEPCDLSIPFTDEALLTLVGQKKTSAAIRLDKENKTAVFKNRLIKLTELESELLALLLSQRRHFSKEEILSSLWDASTDIGVVNVYIHYLREKLESDGEKVIVSARNKGYKIDERFLEGDEV